MSFAAAPLHQIVMVPAKCRQSPSRQRRAEIGAEHGERGVLYRMVAERGNETVRVERQSSLLIVAKARIFASAGWQVVITDQDGKSYAPDEFDRLRAA